MGVFFTAPVMVPYGQQIGATTAEIASFSTVRFAFAFLSLVWMPKLADTKGVKLCLIISCIGTAASYAIQGNSHYFSACEHAVLHRARRNLQLVGRPRMQDPLRRQQHLFVSRQFQPGWLCHRFWDTWMHWGLWQQKRCVRHAGRSSFGWFLWRYSTCPPSICCSNFTSQHGTSQTCAWPSCLHQCKQAILHYRPLLELWANLVFTGHGMWLWVLQSLWVSMWHCSSKMLTNWSVLWSQRLGLWSHLRPMELVLCKMRKPLTVKNRSKRVRLSRIRFLWVMLLAWYCIFQTISALTLLLPLLLEFESFGLKDPESVEKSRAKLASTTSLVMIPHGIANLVVSTVGFLIVFPRSSENAGPCDLVPPSLRPFCASMAFAHKRFGSWSWFMGAVASALAWWSLPLCQRYRGTLQLLIQSNRRRHPLCHSLGCNLARLLVLWCSVPSLVKSRKGFWWILHGWLLE